MSTQTKKQFILTLDWGDTKRHLQVNSMLNQGYSIKWHWGPQIIGEKHTYVFVKEGK